MTEEFAPGFRASTGAYVLSMLREPVWRDLRLVERGIEVDPAGPSLNLFADGSTLHLDDDLGEDAGRVPALLRRRRAGAARVRGRARRDREADPAADRHHAAGPAAAAPRASSLRLGGLAARNRGADLRRAVSVRHLGDPVPRRALRQRTGPGRARLARDQRLDRRALDPGDRLRPPARPRLRAGRRRDPPVGIRPRRDRPADRGDGRRGARGRGRDPHRGAGASASSSRAGAPPGSSSPTASRSAPRRVLSNADPKTTFLGLLGRRRAARPLPRPRVGPTAARARA